MRIIRPSAKIPERNSGWILGGGRKKEKGRRGKAGQTDEDQFEGRQKEEGRREDGEESVIV